MSYSSAVSGIPGLDNLKNAKANIIGPREVNNFYKKEEEKKLRMKYADLQT